MMMGRRGFSNTLIITRSLVRLSFAGCNHERLSILFTEIPYVKALENFYNKIHP